MLRQNERVTGAQDWNSRALTLGLFQRIEQEQASHPEDSERLQNFRQAFIIGVRQVIEATTSDGPCYDPVCLTAERKGFFATDLEVGDLEGIQPHCHGRLKNLTTDMASLLGYEVNKGAQLKQVLSTIGDEPHQHLIAKIDAAIDEGMVPEVMTTTPELYSAAGIDDEIFQSLVQINAGSSPDGVTSEEANDIRELLLPRVAPRPAQP